MIKIVLAVPYKGFIENAYQIFRQHNEFYRAVDQENYEMEEVIVTSENVNQIKIEADIVLTRGSGNYGSGCGYSEDHTQLR